MHTEELLFHIPASYTEGWKSSWWRHV